MVQYNEMYHGIDKRGTFVPQKTFRGSPSKMSYVMSILSICGEIDNSMMKLKLRSGLQALSNIYVFDFILVHPFNCIYSFVLPRWALAT